MPETGTTKPPQKPKKWNAETDSKTLNPRNPEKNPKTNSKTLNPKFPSQDSTKP